MSEFIMECPSCGGELQLQDEWIGMEVECPLCHGEFVVENPEIQQTQSDMQTDGENLSPRNKNLKKISLFSALAVIVVLIIAGVYFIMPGGVLPDNIKDREITLLRAIDAVDNQKTTDIDFFNQVMEKAKNDPEFYFIAFYLANSWQKDKAAGILLQGINAGSCGIIYFIYNLCDRSIGGLEIKKAYEIKFLPTIIKLGTLSKDMKVLDKSYKTTPEIEKIISMSEEIQKNGTFRFKMEGNMNSAKGSFVIFNSKVYYVAINDEKPEDVKINGVQWKNLDKPFDLDEKVLPYHTEVFKQIIVKPGIIICWKDSIALYPDSGKEFRVFMDMIKDVKK